MSGLAKAFVDGGEFMYVILFASAFGIAIIIERSIFLLFRYNINAEAFMAQIMQLVGANNIDHAIKLCNAAPTAALPRVIKAGLSKYAEGPMAVSAAIEEAKLEVTPEVVRRTPALQGVANIATLVGLLGTIMGMIQAFDALGTATPENRSAVLSHGIAVAMNTTAFGLIVAVPCLTAHLLLTSFTKKIMDDVELFSTKLDNLLSRRLSRAR
ncbi:MotA/TolQ/ExbB proton channel family protein [Myxococcota bacterium]|nr:MotA/TolQ/ExbB proton channel family protein [Myxococcota bacterium]MBU1380111.1 MotA/TolQ/ExbB proton channel family protein [Myxococcota bacterium]MBU1497151.1 MotA/TolQ/ExbB proton channel family protein [Myxococcota bacterium]